MAQIAKSVDGETINAQFCKNVLISQKMNTIGILLLHSCEFLILGSMFTFEITLNLSK
jgi:hypothetical protein